MTRRMPDVVEEVARLRAELDDLRGTALARTWPLRVGYDEHTADQIGITAETQIMGFSATVVLQSQRRLRISMTGRVRHSDAGSVGIGWMRQVVGATSTFLPSTWYEFTSGAANQRFKGCGFVEVIRPAGSYVFRPTLQLVAGPGTLDFEAAANRAAVIEVLDLGPA